MELGGRSSRGSALLRPWQRVQVSAWRESSYVLSPGQQESFRQKRSSSRCREASSEMRGANKLRIFTCIERKCLIVASP